MQSRIREASRDTLKLAAGHLIEELKESFAAHASVQSFLDEVLQDIVETGEQFRTETRGEDDEIAEISGSLPLTRYQVNLLVGHGADAHAPVVDCDNPTYPQLVGRVDHVAHMGALFTNFTMIRAGALHRANGGYLLLDAVQVLTRPQSWDGLKRALLGGKVIIESLPETLGLGGGTPSLEPQPVPLSLKVVLFGERQHYYLLQALDPEFDQLFRVAADFEDDVPRDAATVASLAQCVGGLARELHLRPCDPTAVARLVEQAARESGHAARLSTETSLLEELLHEADTHAARDGSARITRAHIEAALAAREHRSDRLRQRLRTETLENTLLIATTGLQVGQVNGLAVTDLVDYRFGHPIRITATARLGDDKVVDIEREAALGQPLHSKGVLILSSYLAARYAASVPLAISASLVFEQSYGPVEGDSASLAELCALLSALGRVPVRQSLAVTGSVNQFGGVQAIGAVNEKVEGFFDLCQARGLTGEQGVLIPATNIPHLMLRQDVVQAVAEGKFHVCPVATVDEALALLSGLPAGSEDASGQWTPDSFNHRVAQRVEQLSLARQTYGIGQRPRLRKPRHPAPLGTRATRADEPPDD
jgi:predicted ATP-dependent protease